MARVFLSYSSKDHDLAVELHAWLKGLDHEVFFDRDLQDGLLVGDEWQERLHERLRWADAVLCIVTTAYLNSVWCSAELGVAQSRGIRVLPVLVETGVRHPLLSSGLYQFADYDTDPDTAKRSMRCALARIDSGGGQSWPDGRSPYPGLQPLDVEWQQVFFGRRAETEALCRTLRSPDRTAAGVLLVAGPSGCGKSSLVRAGVVPAMAREAGWITLRPMLPGADPIGALARELATAARSRGLPWTLSTVDHRLQDPQGLAELVDDLLATTPGVPLPRLLLVIDQFEELVVRTPAPSRQRFAELLRVAAEGSVRLVATARPEFLTPILECPELLSLPPQVVPLRPLHHDMLATVVHKPAELAGIRVDDELVAQLVADTGTGEALPLLAFTLAQLSVDVGRGDTLSLARYESLGRVQGALVRQADAALLEAQATTGRGRVAVVDGLLRLVTVDERGEPARRRVPRDQLPPEVAAELNAFVARRLVTTDTEDDVVVVGVAHEAVLSTWSPLADAITATATALRAQRLVEEAAAEWSMTGRPPERLWERGQLAAVLSDTGAELRRSHSGFLSSNTVDLNAVSKEFLQASMRRDRRRRARAVVVLSILLAISLAAGSTALVFLRSARAGQEIATARSLLVQTDGLLASDPLTAMKLAATAQTVHDDPGTRIHLVQTLTSTRFAGTVAGHTGEVNGVSFSPDGNTMATAGMDGNVVLWDAGHSLVAKLDQGRPATWTQFSPDGHLLAVGTGDGRLRLWDVADRAHPRPLGTGKASNEADFVYVAFSPDGRMVATGTVNRRLILWDVTDPARPVPLGQPITAFRDLLRVFAFAPGGHTLIVGDDAEVSMWDVRKPAKPVRLPTVLPNAAGPLALSADGRTLVTGTSVVRSTEWKPQQALIWDISQLNRPSRKSPPLANPNGMAALAISPDGGTLAIAYGDRTARLWNIDNPDHPIRMGESITGQREAPLAMAFSPDGTQVATSSPDGTATLWVVQDRALPRILGEIPLPGRRGPYQTAQSPDGRTIAVADPGNEDVGTERVMLWDLTDRGRPTAIGRPLTGVGGRMAFSPDGRLLATASPEGIQLWDVRARARPIRLGKPLPESTDSDDSFDFSPDGRLIAGGGDSQTIAVWDIADPSHPTLLAKPKPSHSNAVYSTAFNPDGRTLVGTSMDGTAILWDLADPQHPTILGKPLTDHSDGVTSAAFSRDGRYLATGSRDRTIILYDVSDPGRPARVGTTLNSQSSQVDVLTFSPDGKTLMSGSYDGTAVLWDLTDSGHAKPLGPSLPRFNPVVSAQFSPDGAVLTTSGSTAIVAWDLGRLNTLRRDPLQEACRILGHGLTQDEWNRYVSGLQYRDTCKES